MKDFLIGLFLLKGSIWLFLLNKKSLLFIYFWLLYIR